MLKKKLTCVFLSLIILGGIFITSCSGNKPVEKKSETLSESYDKLLKKLVFKGECYVTAGGKEIYDRGIDYANKDKKIKNNKYTLYPAASVTKQFTAAAVMILCERGKLSLKDKIGKFFPDYKYGESITVDDLLRMRSGIPDYINKKTSEVFPEGYNPETHSARENRECIYKKIKTLPLNFKPGEKFEYTNSGYFLLAEIVDKLSGTSYKSFLKKEFFDKLGMSSTGFIDDIKNSLDNYARPYGDKSKSLDINIKGIAYGSSDIVTNAVDLSKWAYALQSGKVISKNALSVMTEAEDKYGCGLYVSDDKTFAHHTGSFVPYRSALLFTPGDKKFNCVVFTNSGFVQVDYLAECLYKEYYKKR
ncbi:MAG: serine hydrolase domain-containing protein [Ruminococcus sp.]|nr:serine hydrolase domain-containing protein [Ruminococcus sp.]